MLGLKNNYLLINEKNKKKNVIFKCIYNYI